MNEVNEMCPASRCEYAMENEVLRELLDEVEIATGLEAVRDVLIEMVLERDSEIRRLTAKKPKKSKAIFLEDTAD